MYFGKREGLNDFLKEIGKPMPLYSNPSDYVLDLVNTDF